MDARRRRNLKKTHLLSRNLRGPEIALNEAFRTSKIALFCAVIYEAVRSQNNVTEFASKAGLNRTNLYRAFGVDARSHLEKDPSINCIVQILARHCLILLKNRSIKLRARYR
jgi:DNA-binding phage protein